MALPGLAAITAPCSKAARSWTPAGPHHLGFCTTKGAVQRSLGTWGLMLVLRQGINSPKHP